MPIYLNIHLHNMSGFWEYANWNSFMRNACILMLCLEKSPYVFNKVIFYIFRWYYRHQHGFCFGNFNYFEMCSPQILGIYLFISNNVACNFVTKHVYEWTVNMSPHIFFSNTKDCNFLVIKVIKWDIASILFNNKKMLFSLLSCPFDKDTYIKVDCALNKGNRTMVAP